MNDIDAAISKAHSAAEAAEVDEAEAPEGRLLTRTHQVRERNATLIKRKKKEVIHLTGKLACEVCGFDFYCVYGELGSGFAECHHTKPISKLLPGKRLVQRIWLLFAQTATECPIVDANGLLLLS